jgi:TetR/AcrR family transcriptional regulator
MSATSTADVQVGPPPRPRGRAGRRPGAAGTRQALLAAGTALFAERGYDGVPVWAVAQRAGVNKAMISYHFGGKRKLYLAILGATFAEIVSRVEALADARRPAPEVLRDLVAEVGDLASRRYPHFCAMMLREVLAGGAHLDGEVAAYPARILAAVQRIVERGVRDGAFRPVDPLLTHLSLVGSLVFFFATAGFRERLLGRHLGLALPDADAYVKHIQDLVTHGLAAATADEGIQPGRRTARWPSPPRSRAKRRRRS